MRYRAHLALGMLLLVYAFNFIDRIMLGILVPPIKHEFLLTDTELGLLGGTAFALFYTALGIPIGWLADRLNRVWIVTISLALWSAFTAACGAAHHFAQLFAARLGVGVGEAGGVAPAYALISDYFAPARRARALAVYSFGIPLGSAAGILFGGLIAARVNWRAAFLIVGAAGLILAPVFRLCVREPVRGGLDAPPAATDAAAGAPAGPVAAPRLGEVARLLAGKPSFWYLSLGAASASVMGYGVYFWMPSFLVRSYHLSLPQVSVCFSALTFISGVAGIWLGGALADRFGSTRRAAYALVPAIAFLASVPLYAVGLLARASLSSLPIFVLPMALALAWLGPTASAIQHLVPAGMRALAAALLLFIINLIGLGAGSYAIGALSDHFATARGTESLRYAMLAGSGFYLLAAALYALGARRLARDWHR
jgi:MFS family permease